MTRDFEEVRLLKSELDTQAEELKQSYDAARKHAEAVGLTLALLEQKERDLETPDLTAADVDFKGAKTLTERLARIAERNGGVMNTTQASILIMEAGFSKSKKKEHIRSTIYKTILEHPETWEKVSPGTFRYLDGQAPAPLTMDDPTQ